MSDCVRSRYLDVLAEFATCADLSMLSTSARDRVRWIITDCIPVIATGMQQPEMKALVAKHLAHARFTDLTTAGKSLYAPVRVGMEDARAGAKTGKRATAFDASLFTERQGHGWSSTRATCLHSR